MAVAVVVPWRGGCPHREAAWDFISQRWRTFYAGWELVVGTCLDPWCKGLAVADALTRTDADVIVLADADVWCDGVDAAVEVVMARGGWAVPHWHVRRLDEASTVAVLDGAAFDETLTLSRDPYVGYPGGGLTVISRDLLSLAPIDPRFVGWGQEDQSAAAAWQTLAGKPWRSFPPLWHLWHPPAPRRDRRYGSGASERLWRRYRNANGKPPLMRQLLGEARELLAQP